MSLYSIKKFIVKNTPKFFHNFIIKQWRTGTASTVRIVFEKYRYSKDVRPYFKKINYQNLYLEMYIDVTESWVSKEVDVRGMHEEHILEKIIENLPTGGTFIDVGANVGQHSLFAAKKVGLNGKVFAFEPIDSSAENIRLSARKNSFTWLTVTQKAVTNFIGETVFYKYGLTDISSRSKNFTDRPAEEIQVQATTLDIELTDIERVDLIKIDVEGYEMDVLLGAKEIIEKYKPKIILEFSPVFYEKLKPSDSVDILEFFLKNGYSIEDIDNYVGPVIDVTTYCEEIKKRGNISNILCTYINSLWHRR